MEAARRRTLQHRSPRILSRSEGNFARIFTGSITQGAKAQYRDVSETGMKLISRDPHGAGVGDFIRVEFSPPGKIDKVLGHARVVRIGGEFEFSVQFLHFEKESQKTFLSALADASTKPFMQWWNATTAGVEEWILSHREGLVISFAGIVIASAVCVWIALNSDSFNGRQLRAWGKPLPTQMYLDYYKEFSKDKSADK